MKKMMTSLYGNLRKASAVLVGLTVLILALLLWEVRSTARTDQFSRRPRVVRVDEVAVDESDRTVRFGATTRSARQATLSFTIPGRLQELGVAVGDRVVAGQVLASLDTKPLKNALQAARAGMASASAQLDQAHTDQDRIESLQKQGAMAKSSLEKVEASTAVLSAGRLGAAAQLKEARRQLAEADLVAPFDGVVGETFLDEGEFTGPGVPVLVLSSTDEIEVEVEIPESMLDAIHEGQTVGLDLPFTGRTGIRGTIQSIGRASVLPGRLFPVRIRVEDDDVLPGMSAEVVLTLEADHGLSVPVSAIVDPTGESASVFVVEEARVRRVGVEVGAMRQGSVRVTGDLRPGDRVVVSGYLGLIGGQEVEVR